MSNFRDEISKTPKTIPQKQGFFFPRETKRHTWTIRFWKWSRVKFCFTGVFWRNVHGQKKISRVTFFENVHVSLKILTCNFHGNSMFLKHCSRAEKSFTCNFLRCGPFFFFFFREKFQKLEIVHGRFFFSRVKIGEIVHACFHAKFFCRNCSRVTFCFTCAFSWIVHGWVVKVSRGKKKPCSQRARN